MYVFSQISHVVVALWLLIIFYSASNTLLKSDLIFVKICAKFHRITNISLKHRFHGKLDQHVACLQERKLHSSGKWLDLLTNSSGLTISR